MDSDADGLLQGAMDMHVHPAPSPFPRRLSLLEAAVEAADAGFGAIAVKSHHHSTVTDVLAVEAAVGTLPLRVLSGVCLNHQVGGINPSAVELALGQGGRFVWFPTIGSAKHLACRPALTTFPRDGLTARTVDPIRVVDDRGVLTPEVSDVLEMIGEADAVLACGHLDAAEIDVLISGALARGLGRIVVNHPNFVIGADPGRCASWAARGVFVEHSICHYVEGSTFYKWGVATLLSYVDAVGLDHTMLSSDLGQVDNPTPVEGFRAIVTQLRQSGVDDPAIRRLVGGSARSLID